MITAQEAREKTHGSFLDADLAKINERIHDEIKRNSASFGITISPDQDKFYNLPVAFNEVKRLGYDVYTIPNTLNLHAIIWNDSMFKEKCKLDRFEPWSYPPCQ